MRLRKENAALPPRHALAAVLGLGLLVACAGPEVADRAACAADPAHWVRGADGGCSALQVFGPARAEVLVVVLHGDVSGGGPASYHRALARRAAETLPGAAAVALVRPGYPDGEGRTSDGEPNNRSDHLTAANIARMASAVAALRQRTGARHVVALGHSGGAATAADILALHPGTLDAAVLLACPCDLDRWRLGRTPWTGSVSPRAVADRVPAGTRVVAFTGSADGNTGPELAEAYVAVLAARGLPARFVSVPGATHNGIIDAAWEAGLGEALREASR